MPDTPDLRVAIARLEGRIDGVERGLTRQEQNCSDRSERHLDLTLYASERDTMRQDISEVRTLIAAQERDHARAIQKVRDELEAEKQRRKDDAAEAAKEQRKTRIAAWGIAIGAGGLVTPFLLAALS